jgi:outer membrane protein
VAIARDQLEQLTYRPPDELRDVTTLQAMGPQPDTPSPWLDTALKNQPLPHQAQATLKTSEERRNSRRRQEY